MSYRDGGWKEKYRIEKIVMKEVCLLCQEKQSKACFIFGEPAEEIRNNECFHCPQFTTKPVSSKAQYFVLRYDTDPNARVAMLAYADSVEAENPVFAKDIRQKVGEVTHE